MQEDQGRVGPIARALGFAGLLPPAASLVAIIAQGSAAPMLDGLLIYFADLYAAIILSFLGGIWWGFAMRRSRGHGALAAVAVVPSLVAAALLCACILWDVRWGTVALGCAVLLTLPVDRHLASRGEAPAGWMALRIPLSLGLGALTIAAGSLLG